MIVKLAILNQNMLQVTLVEYQQLVNTFIVHRANPALGNVLGEIIRDYYREAA